MERHLSEFTADAIAGAEGLEDCTYDIRVDGKVTAISLVVNGHTVTYYGPTSKWQIPVVVA